MHSAAHSLSVVSSDTPMSVSSSLTATSATASPFCAAWEVLTTERSWLDPSKWAGFQAKHGLYEAKDLEFLSDVEVEELMELLATVPFKKFKKLISV
jgi:hypothetical protein